MTEEERKKHAEQITTNPLFQDRFNAIENHFIEQMVNLEMTHEERHEGAVCVDVIRTLRREFNALLIETPSRTASAG